MAELTLYVGGGGGTELFRYNYVNIIVTNALAPCVTRSSAAIILAM